MISGEPLPVAKEPGATVVGGTLNTTGAFSFTATAVGSDTALARIVQMVRNAQASKAPAQRLADTAGKYLVFVALGAGLEAAAELATRLVAHVDDLEDGHGPIEMDAAAAEACQLTEPQSCSEKVRTWSHQASGMRPSSRPASSGV